MPCTRPIPAARLIPENFAAWSLIHPGHKMPKIIVGRRALSASTRFYDLISLPCGKCLDCLRRISRDWSIRLFHELEEHGHASFITLTYNDENIPRSDKGFNTLNKRDIQLFFKRFRKEISPQKIRYYLCGEYGSRTHRPHYHAIIYGYDFPDKYFFFKSGRNYVFRSPLLEKLWPYGISSIGDVTADSVCYVAGYVQKKLFGPKFGLEFGDAEPSFSMQSTRPGIASAWIHKYYSDVYKVVDSEVVKDYCRFKQFLHCRPPRYFDKLFALNHATDFDTIKANRARKAADCLLTPEELRRKEDFAKLQHERIMKDSIL